MSQRYTRMQPHKYLSKARTAGHVLSNAFIDFLFGIAQWVCEKEYAQDTDCVHDGVSVEAVAKL